MRNDPDRHGACRGRYVSLVFQPAGSDIAR